MGSAGTAFFPILRQQDAKAAVAHMAALPHQARLAKTRPIMGVPPPINLNNRDIRIANGFLAPPTPAGAQRAKDMQAQKMLATAKKYPAVSMAETKKILGAMPPAAALARAASKSMPFAARAGGKNPRKPLYVFYLGQNNVNSVASVENDDFADFMFAARDAEKLLKKEPGKPGIAFLLAKGNRRASDDKLRPGAFRILDNKRYNAFYPQHAFPNIPMRHTQLQRSKP